MATATIHRLFCVQHATGVDFKVLKALFSVLPLELFSDKLPVPVLEHIRDIPEVVKIIDNASGDPDQLYISTGSDQIEDAIWPGGEKTVDLLAGESAEPNVQIEFSGSQNIALFEEDLVSDDDLLGAITILESEQGQGEIAKFASSNIEDSAYYVIYSVK